MHWVWAPYWESRFLQNPTAGLPQSLDLFLVVGLEETQTLTDSCRHCLKARVAFVKHGSVITHFSAHWMISFGSGTEILSSKSTKKTPGNCHFNFFATGWLTADKFKPHMTLMVRGKMIAIRLWLWDLINSHYGLPDKIPLITWRSHADSGAAERQLRLFHW